MSSSVRSCGNLTLTAHYPEVILQLASPAQSEEEDVLVVPMQALDVIQEAKADPIELHHKEQLKGEARCRGEWSATYQTHPAHRARQAAHSTDTTQRIDLHIRELSQGFARVRAMCGGVQRAVCGGPNSSSGQTRSRHRHGYPQSTHRRRIPDFRLLRIF